MVSLGRYRGTFNYPEDLRQHVPGCQLTTQARREQLTSLREKRGRLTKDNI